MKKKQIKKHCFIEGNRACTLKCKAAYEENGKISCSILWALTQVGWANLKKGVQAYKEVYKKK